MFGATLLLAMRQIRRHLLRSSLTTIGIIIGVAAVVTMVTLGKGLTASIQQQIASLGSDVLIAFPQQADNNRQPRPFKQDDVIAVREQLAGVKSVAGNVNKNIHAFHNGQSWSTKIEGVSNAFMDARGIKMDQLACAFFLTPEQTAPALPWAEVFRAECRAMNRGDVPLFSYRSDEQTICADDRAVGTGILRGTGRANR